MQNPEIAKVLDEIADLLKVGEHNLFFGSAHIVRGAYGQATPSRRLLCSNSSTRLQKCRINPSAAAWGGFKEYISSNQEARRLLWDDRTSLTADEELHDTHEQQHDAKGGDRGQGGSLGGGGFAVRNWWPGPSRGWWPWPYAQ